MSHMCWKSVRGFPTSDVSLTESVRQSDGRILFISSSGTCTCCYRRYLTIAHVVFKHSAPKVDSSIFHRARADAY